MRQESTVGPCCAGVPQNVHKAAVRVLSWSSAVAHRSTAAALGQQSITITTPDDWHLHVRDGENMVSVVPYTAAHFGRAIIMPNLVPPVTTTELVSIESM